MRVAVVVAVVVAAAAVGCDERVYVEAAGALGVEPTRCDFGEPDELTINDCTVTISNEGNAPLTVDMEMGGDDAFDLIGGIADSLIGEDAHLDFVVRFAPGERRAYEGVLHVTSDDPVPERQAIDVALVGDTSAP